MYEEKRIQVKTVVYAPIKKVWEAWTTIEGVKTFFAPAANIELKPMGKYEMLFDPSAPKGKQGGEGCVILAHQEEKMLSFTWNQPPHLTEVRPFYTSIILRFAEVEKEKTAVVLTHTGWGEGGQWDEAFNYFQSAWNEVVFPRMEQRFKEGPIDWSSKQ